MVLDPADLGQLRVDPGQVVVLLEVLADQLPVGLDLDVTGFDRAPFLQPVRRSAIGQITDPVFERHGGRIEAGEDQHTPLVDPDLMQAVVGWIEVFDAGLGEARRRDQRAIEVVAPSVIRAADRVADLAVTLGEFSAAVATAIEEAAQLTVAVAGEHNRGATDVAHEHASLHDLIDQCDGDPRGAEDPLLFEVEERRVGVASSGE